MKKILIVGAGITANEICKKIKKKFHVSTCGTNSNDLAVKNLNNHYILNYKKNQICFFLVFSKIPIGFLKSFFFVRILF